MPRQLQGIDNVTGGVQTFAFGPTTASATMGKRMTYPKTLPAISHSKATRLNGNAVLRRSSICLQVRQPDSVTNYLRSTQANENVEEDP